MVLYLSGEELLAVVSNFGDFLGTSVSEPDGFKYKPVLESQGSLPVL